MKETIKGKRLIGHSAEEDYYEDTKGNTYSYDGKEVKSLKDEISEGKQDLWIHKEKKWGMKVKRFK